MGSPTNLHPERRSRPRVIAWDGAAGEILREAASRAGRAAPLVVGVTGRVGSGKSTLASLLSACIVPTDMYLPDYDRLPEHERDNPSHADLARLVQDLETLRRGRAAAIPFWSFHSHRREGFAELAPAAVVVCEGIHALCAEVTPHLDVAVFVTAPAATRWARCEARELTGARGWGVDVAREFFQNVAEPTFEKYETDYLGRAHLLVENHAPPVRT